MFHSTDSNTFNTRQWQNNTDLISNFTWEDKELRLEPLPDLPFGINHVEHHPSDNKSVSTATSTTTRETEQEEEQDVWMTSILPPTMFNTHSWDTHNTHFPSYAQTQLAKRKIGTPFISEAPVSLFEPLVERSNTTVIHETDLAKSIVQAMVGLPSMYFCWEQGKLKQRVPHLRILGVSSTAIEPVIEHILLFGTRLKSIEHVAHQLQSQPKQYGLTGVAFGCCLAELHVYIQHVIVQTLSQETTILKVYQYIEHLSMVLERLCTLCQIQGQGFNLPFGAALLNLLYEEASQFDLASNGSSALYRDICLTLQSYTSVPYLNMLSSWLHLNGSDYDQQDPWHEFFISVREDTTDILNKYQVQEDTVLPYFIHRHFALYLLRSGISLYLLKISRPNHPIFQLDDSLSLRHRLIPSESDRYMLQLDKIKKAIERYNAGKSPLDMPRPPQVIDHDTLMQDTIPTLPLLNEHDAFSNGFSSTLQAILQYHQDNQSCFIPTLETITLQSYIRPLQAWCPVLNASFMSCFLGQFKLESHLSCLYRYFLLGDGTFMNGLKSVFFCSPDKIDIDKESWPPKTFTLTMALRDVLLEASLHQQDDLVSFHCQTSDDTNPNSIEALDFLDLVYETQYPFGIVITPSILSKYNRMFSFLLRLVRVQTLTKRMYEPLRHLAWFRTSTRDKIFRYRFQFDRFISGLSSYVHDSVIRGTWTPFMQHVKGMQSSHPRQGRVMDYVSVIMEPQAFREYHEHVLDCILFQCFLKQSQTRIMQVLISVLQDIILFGVILDDYRSTTLEHEDKLEMKCRKIFEQFQKNMTVFLHVLTLLEQKGSGRLGNILNTTRKSIFNELYIKHEGRHGIDVFVKDLLIRLNFYEQ